MNNHRNPDIQRLLASLRGDVTQIDPKDSQRPKSDVSMSQSSRGSAPASTPGLGLLPLPALEIQVDDPTNPRSLTPHQVPHHLPPEPLRDHSVALTIPDASTITTWPAALKHVTKHVIMNPKAVSKIKHLILEQHKHERQWWAGREAIVSRHNGRAGNQAKVADLLKSLGGASVPLVPHDPKADQAELEAYDKKVYRSLVDMTADFDRQLRALQIPFFAIKHDLVILEAGLQKEAATKGRVDKGELRELQKRMVETLEDLLDEE